MVLKTLREMAKGGMHDQLGGGFHRYSVDERWFVPHFEKMLYDQGQLAIAYLEAFQITRDEQYAAVARRIFDYVLRDMTEPAAPSIPPKTPIARPTPREPNEKGEGAFYIWSADEIRALVEVAPSDWFFHRYGVPEAATWRTTRTANSPAATFSTRPTSWKIPRCISTARGRSPRRRSIAPPRRCSPPAESARARISTTRSSPPGTDS
jgi:uncharacterized protein YyaL (SSP411 family)